MRWVAVALLLHLLLAAALGLSPDEAHYALYARHLDWSYFDHPPLVGWVQWPWLQLGGDDLLMRVVPLGCWLIASVGLVRLTRALWADDAPLLSRPYGGPPPIRQVLLLWLLSPLPHLLGVALVPDTLLLPLVCLLMIITWRLASAQSAQRLSLWVAMGLCLGLAGLAKYTAALLALSVLIALTLAHGTRLLRMPGLWIAALVALLLITPVLVWNATHDWISFAYQFGRISGEDGWRPTRLAGFVAVQLLAFGLLPAWGVAVARGEPGRLTPRGLCLSFGLPLLALLVYLSGRGMPLPHWSAPAWLALLPLAARGLQQSWWLKGRALTVLAGWQALVCAAALVLLLTGGWATEREPLASAAPGEHLDKAERNPMADLHGWAAASARARTLAEREGLPALAVMNWSLASRLAWYARPLPVHVVQRRDDQFDLWFGGLQPGAQVLLVDWSAMGFAPPVGAQAFRTCTLLEQWPVMHAGRQLAHFNFQRCEDWQGPPRPRPGTRAARSPEGP